MKWYIQVQIVSVALCGFLDFAFMSFYDDDLTYW